MEADVAGEGKPPAPEATPSADPEQPTAGAANDDAVVTSVVRRWKREDLVEKSTMVLRAVGGAFAVLSAVVMGSNKHGDWKDFDQYQEYKYLVAIGVLGFLYTGLQVGRQVHRLRTGRDLVPRRHAAVLDFAGDQVTAYFMISALSAAIPLTNRMREGADNMFTDASAASISMAFFSFLSLALSALISGFKLSKQTYI